MGGIFCSSVIVTQMVTLRFGTNCEFVSCYCDCVSDICSLASHGDCLLKPGKKITLCLSFTVAEEGVWLKNSIFSWLFSYWDNTGLHRLCPVYCFLKGRTTLKKKKILIMNLLNTALIQLSNFDGQTDSVSFSRSRPVFSLKKNPGVVKSLEIRKN